MSRRPFQTRGRLATGIGAAVVMACGATVTPPEVVEGDAGSPDAGPARAPDATADDSGTRDGSANEDASTNDVADVATIDAAFACSDAQDFCDDFEGTRALQGQWSSVGIAGTGALSIEAGTLHGQLDRGDSAAGHYAALVLDQPWTPTDAGARRRVHIQFRARVDVCPVETPVTLARVALNGALVDLWLQRDLVNECTALAEEILMLDGGGASYRGSGALLVTLGAWADYDFDLPEPAAGIPTKVNLKVGAAATSLVLTGGTTPPSDYYQIFGAAQGTLAGVAADVHLDDFRVDYLR